MFFLQGNKQCLDHLRQKCSLGFHLQTRNALVYRPFHMKILLNSFHLNSHTLGLHPLTAGIEIATHWSPVRPIIECWQPDVRNWSPVNNPPFLSSTFYPWRKNTLLVNERYDLPVFRKKKGFLDHKPNHHVWISLLLTKNQSCIHGVNPSFC